MLDPNKIQIVIDLLGDDAETVSRATIAAKLIEAKAAIMQKIWINYPNMPDDAEMPNHYDILQCQLAIRYINRMGIEGQVSHDSNGTSRAYASPDDADIMQKVVPIARCV